jgi:hypothetical protein
MHYLDTIKQLGTCEYRQDKITDQILHRYAGRLQWITEIRLRYLEIYEYCQAEFCRISWHKIQSCFLSLTANRKAGGGQPIVVIPADFGGISTLVHPTFPAPPGIIFDFCIITDEGHCSSSAAHNVISCIYFSLS